MSTTFLLHGGKTTIPSESNIEYFTLTADPQQKNTKILIVPFAGKEEDYESLFEIDKQKFLSYTGRTDLNFELASTDLKKLEKQIKNSDVLYIRGGATDPVKEIFKNLSNLKELIDGKIVSGTSAGAIMWSRWYYENDTDSIEEGLGILNVKIISHYGKEYHKMLLKLDNYGEALYVITLEEEEFKIVTL